MFTNIPAQVYWLTEEILKTGHNCAPLLQLNYNSTTTALPVSARLIRLRIKGGWRNLVVSWREV